MFRCGLSVSAIFFLSFQCLLCPCSSFGESISCGSTFVVDSPGFVGGPTEVIVYLARKVDGSVIAEIRSDAQRVSFTAGQLTIDQALSHWSVDLKCELVQGVLHIFSPSVVNARSNQLNHRFATFRIPPDTEHLRLDLRQRLHEEPWQRAPGMSVMVQPGTGYFDPNYSDYPLKEEVLRNTSARDVLFHVARERKLAVSLLYPIENWKDSSRDVWLSVENHWNWTNL